MKNPFSKNGLLRTRTRAWRRGLPKRLATARATKKARAARKNAAATFIAVTGSAAKSTTVAMLDTMLSAAAKTRSQVIENTLLPVAQFMGELAGDETFVLMETGTYVPGDIARMAALIRPDVAVVTRIGNDHIEDFGSKEAIAREKAALVAALPVNGLAVLNADDPHVMSMAGRTSARVVTFGSHQDADYRLVSAKQAFPGPLVIEIAAGGRRHCLTVAIAGVHFGLSVAAAFATAIELGVAPEDAVAGLAGFQPVFNRCSSMTTPRGQVIVLDAHKGAQDSLSLAYDIAAMADAPHRRIVQGPISYIVGDVGEAYRNAYQLARQKADEIIFVGPLAHLSGAPETDRRSGRYFEFPDFRSVHDHLARTARPGEVIVIKGSLRYHLERIAIAFETAVRCEEETCGFKVNCLTCGLYGSPFSEHKAIRKGRQGVGGQ